MAHNTFIVSDESVNAYGFVILTSGINTEQFRKNPVMFHMHERKSGIIGRWENIRIDGGKLLADAIFDETIELGQSVKTRVENGFIRSASIGVENIEKDIINGVETVTSCDLKEISIVDIPANANAVKLYKKGGRCVCKLSDLDAEQEPETDTEPEADLRTQIINLLGLDDTATDDDIITNIKALLSGSESAEESVREAVRLGFIESSQKSHFLAMANANFSAFKGFISNKKQEQKKELAELVLSGIKHGKLLPQERHMYDTVGEVLGANMVRRILDTIPERVSLSERIGNKHLQNRASWGLAEYRKFAPEELRDNPALYQQLIEKEGREIELNTDTIDWYRRHNPEYLKNHLESYQKVLYRTKSDN